VATLLLGWTFITRGLSEERSAGWENGPYPAGTWYATALTIDRAILSAISVKPIDLRWDKNEAVDAGNRALQVSEPREET
jgi:hypothetical protein